MPQEPHPGDVTTETVEAGEARIPRLGLGTWQLTGAACTRAVETALELGYRHLDTAQLYGNERQVGEGLAASGVDRDDVFLTTKLDPLRNLAPARVRSSLEASLARLGVDRVDLLLIHWPNPLASLPAALEAMAAVRKEGLVDHLGISNYSVRGTRRALALCPAPLVTNQVSYHLWRDRGSLLALLRERGMALTAYSPLAHGSLLRDPVLHQVAEERELPVTQVALAWLLQQDSVVTIPKATSREHLEANLGARDVHLTDDEVARLTRPSALRAGWHRFLAALRL